MKIRRKWQIFPGRTRFYCNGRLMLSHQSGIFFISFGLILVTNVLYFVFDCPYLATELSVAFPIAGALLCALVMSSLFRTAFMDPGILPRAQRYEAAYYEAEAALAEQANQLANINTGYRNARTKELLIGGQQVKLKWCLTCKVFRPPRVSHCSVCDNCVERFDHHCPWVGNCVGARNYRYFYYFILTLTIDAVYILACNILHIVALAREFNFLEALRLTPATIIEAFICFLSLWSLVGLLGYHSYLLMRNLTTNEDIKGSFSKRRGRDVFNPFARSTWLHNCCFVLCSSTPPSLIDTRALYLPDVEIDNYRNNNPGLTSVQGGVSPSANNNTIGPSAAFTPNATFQRGSSFYGNSRHPGGAAAAAPTAAGTGGGFCRDRTALGGSIFDADDVNIDRNTYQVVGQCVYILSEAEARVANAEATAANSGWAQQQRQPPLSTPVSMNIPATNGTVATSSTAAPRGSNGNAVSPLNRHTDALPRRPSANSNNNSVQARNSVPTLLSRNDPQRRSSVIVHHHRVPPAAAMRKTSAGNYSGASGDTNANIISTHYSASTTVTAAAGGHHANTGFVKVADPTGACEIYPVSFSTNMPAKLRPGEPQVMSTNDDVAVVFRKPSPSFVSSSSQSAAGRADIRGHSSSSSGEQQQQYRKRFAPDVGGVVNVAANDDFENAVIIGADEDEYNLPTSPSRHTKSSPVPPQLPPKQLRRHHSTSHTSGSGAGGRSSVSDAFAATVNEIQTLHGLLGPSVEVLKPSFSQQATEGDMNDQRRSRR